MAVGPPGCGDRVRAGQAAAVGGPQVVMNRWGGSALVAAVFGSWQIRLVPRAAGVAGWLRNGLGVITGLAAVGAVRGAQLLLGPFQALRMGIGLMAVPEATRVLTRSRRRLNTFCVLLGSQATAGMAWGFALLLLPPARVNCCLALCGMLPLLSWCQAAQRGHVLVASD